jgi:hypothetical protein
LIEAALEDAWQELNKDGAGGWLRQDFQGAGRMQQKTEGRVVRLLSKHLAAEDRAVEQWFLVAIDDDEKAKETISNTAKGVNEVVEVIGNIPASRLANWGLTDGEVRLVLPGEPLTESQ